MLDKCVVYCTAKSESLDMELQDLPDLLQAVVFFSPSGVKFALKQVLDCSKEIKALIAIGPTTHQALQQARSDGDRSSQIPLYQAQTPDADGVKNVLCSIKAETMP